MNAKLESFINEHAEEFPIGTIRKIIQRLREHAENEFDIDSVIQTGRREISEEEILQKMIEYSKNWKVSFKLHEDAHWMPVPEEGSQVRVVEPHLAPEEGDHPTCTYAEATRKIEEFRTKHAKSKILLHNTYSHRLILA